MMKRNLVFLCVLSGLLLAADSIRLKVPENGSVAQNMTERQRHYVGLSEEESRKILESKEPRTYFRSQQNASFPAGVLLEWAFTGPREAIQYYLHLSSNKNFKGTKPILVPDSTFRAYNLELGKKYYWKVEVRYKDGKSLFSEVFNFTVDETAPRVMYAPNVKNIRDLGGRKGIAGRIIKQGLIYRSAGLNFNSKDGKVPGQPQFNDEGKDLLLNTLKIRTDLDLRSERETANMPNSPLGKDVNFIHISSTAYAGVFKDSGRQNYAQLFRVFTNPDSYPIDFHCIAGADRTGSLAFMLEALLGVEREELRRDYTFTSFSSVRGDKLYEPLVKGLQALGTPEEPLQYKAERYFLQCGISAMEILQFQERMLGPELPVSPVLEEGKQQMLFLKNFQAKPVTFTPKPAFTYSTKMPLCGKSVSYNWPIWRQNYVTLSGEKDGEVRLILEHSQAPAFMNLIPQSGLDPKASFVLLDAKRKVAYMTPKGAQTWTSEQLAQMRFSLQTIAPAWLRILPGTSIPDGYTSAAFPKTQDGAPNYIKTAVTKNAPVINGKLDDEIWKTAEPLHPVRVDNGAVHKDCTFRLAINDAYDTLFIAAHMRTKDIQVKTKERDGKVYEDDALEIFLSSNSHRTYYQFVVNADNVVFDSKKNAVDWNTDQFSSATARVSDGWTVEVAIPLKQFKFTNALELNLCTDCPSTKVRANLGAPVDDYHERTSYRPLLYK